MTQRFEISALLLDHSTGETRRVTHIVSQRVIDQGLRQTRNDLGRAVDYVAYKIFVGDDEHLYSISDVQIKEW